jgi:peptidoglycan-N-acetylglucosamine deacetylase
MNSNRMRQIRRTWRILSLTCFLLATAYPVAAEDGGSWNGKPCAVVLTYDDALNVHLDNVIPALDSLGLKGTFYIIGSSDVLRNRMSDWAAAAKRGHELGNHTLFHPCVGGVAGREWVPRDYELNHYTKKRMVDEIAMANTLLESLDGKKQRTFAYPCGDMSAGDSSYVRDVMGLCSGARGVQGKLETLDGIDIYNIGSFMINGQPGEDLVRLVDDAMASHALVVFLFHGVGGEHSINVSLDAHRELLQYLKKQEKSVWVGTLSDVVEWLRKSKGM